MLPVVGYFSPEEIAQLKSRGGLIKSLVATHLNVEPDQILDYELSLYPTDKADIVGVNNEYFQSGRIDDLSMAFASLEAMLAQCDTPSEATRVIAIFDNEETGSGTKQGAHSPILKSILRRLAGNEDNYIRGVASSFMVSADDAHAWHPNYNEKYDPTNHPVMGGGPVVKINANCKYMTDAHGAAIFHSLCDAAGEKYQYFVNHSDVAGGSTLGNILTAQIDIAGVDVGNAIWAMHSARETASVSDHISMVHVFQKFLSL
jgi:aspartyl aminopeptidase